MCSQLITELFQDGGYVENSCIKWRDLLIIFLMIHCHVPSLILLFLLATRGVKRIVGWANYVYFSQFLYGLFSLGGHHEASIVWW